MVAHTILTLGAWGRSTMSLGTSWYPISRNKELKTNILIGPCVEPCFTAQHSRAEAGGLWEPACAPGRVLVFSLALALSWTIQSRALHMPAKCHRCLQSLPFVYLTLALCGPCSMWKSKCLVNVFIESFYTLCPLYHDSEQVTAVGHRWIARCIFFHLYHRNYTVLTLTTRSLNYILSWV